MSDVDTYLLAMLEKQRYIYTKHRSRDKVSGFDLHPFKN
jgi:hypothetical protein